LSFNKNMAQAAESISSREPKLKKVETKESITKKLPELVKMMNRARNLKADPKVERQLIKNIFLGMEDALNGAGAKEVVDVNEIYRRFKGERLILRRDDPRLLVQNIVNDKDYEINFDEKVGYEYANCVEWNTLDGINGLQNTFIEGWAQLGGIVAVVGFKKGKDLELKTPDDNFKEFFKLNRDLVRIGQGKVSNDNIKFVIFRIPEDRFPENELTEQEEERIDDCEEKGKKCFIFRGFEFN